MTDPVSPRMKTRIHLGHPFCHPQILTYAENLGRYTGI